MGNKILKEITEFCKECASHECCPEEYCVLYRIEQIITNKTNKKGRTNKKTNQRIRGTRKRNK